jgi:DNA-binding transcriptional ArsR family regulator
MQSTTSANLSVLANAGLVSARREGRSIFYAATPARFSRAVAFLMDNSADEYEGDPGLGARKDLGHDAA